MRFLIVSFDGLRPDLVAPDLTPNLCRLQAQGITLSNHRTVYPSETRSAFPSLVTGSTTSRHGMVGNIYVDRSVTPSRYIDTEDAVLLRKLDLESGGRLMSTQTLGEILASAGRSLAVLATNSPGTTRFFHHKAEDFGHVRLSGHFREACTPDDLLAEAEELVGPLPPKPPSTKPDKAGQDWVTSAFLDVIWPKCRPDVTVLSYGEPDVSSHFHGTGAEATRTIIAHCDHQFGRVLDWWEAEGRAEGVQIIAISDHGHITGHTQVSVVERLRDAGCRPGTAPAPDVDVVVVPGQVGALYLADPSDERIARIVATITGEPWCGPVFTRAKNDIEGIALGSLGSHLVFIDHVRAPDVSFASARMTVSIHSALSAARSTKTTAVQASAFMVVFILGNWSPSVLLLVRLSLAGVFCGPIWDLRFRTDHSAPLGDKAAGKHDRPGSDRSCGARPEGCPRKSQ